MEEEPEPSVESLEKTPLEEEPKDVRQIEDFQEILQLVGSQGKYQRGLLFYVICPIYVVLAFMAMSTIFQIFVPEHFCSVPKDLRAQPWENESLPTAAELEDWKNLTLPREIGADGLPRYSRCSMFVETENGSLVVPCAHGWTYDTADYDRTLATDFDWVCERADYGTQVFTWGMIGGAVGQVVFGVLADRYGRKPMFFISLFIHTVFKFASFFFPGHFTAFLVAQLLSGAGMPLIFLAPSLISAELCDNDFRAKVYSMTWLVWVAGMAAMPLLAWIARDWFLIGMITSVPGLLLFLITYPFLPESPRWLLTTGRLDEAKAIIMKIARVNGNSDKLVPGDLDIMLRHLYDLHKKDERACEGFWSFFTRWRLAKNTIMLSICWSVNCVIYEGITLNTPHMSGNQFLNFFILSITEVPATLLGGYLLDTVGRRWTQAVFFGLCAAACFAGAILVFHPALSILSIIVVILAKFCITLTFLVVYLQATELFPTKLRSTGNSICSTVGSICSIYGPHLVYAGQFYAGAPYIGMGILGVIGAFAAATLPETLHQNLPESLEDANRFGKKHKFWSLLPKDNPAVVKELELKSVDTKGQSGDSSNSIQYCDMTK